MEKVRMNHRERIEACITKSKIDRLPVALWRHFPIEDQSPEGLAKAIVSYQRLYDFDFIKVTPASSFCLKDWGVEDKWSGATEGTRDYTRRVVNSPDDWRKLAVLDPYSGFLGKQIQCLNLLNNEIQSFEPFVQTIFNPLSQAKNLIGGQELIIHLRQYPDAVQEGLEIITESTINFIEAIKETGIAGIFYAVQHANYTLLSDDEYERFGQKYDIRILDATNDFWLNILHIHGEDIMFDRFVDYPVQVINWHDRETSPTLFDGSKIFSGIVCGGLKRENTLVMGTPEIVTEEAMDTITSMSDNPFILGTGCVVPIIAPHANIAAARLSVEKLC